MGRLGAENIRLNPALHGRVIYSLSFPPKGHNLGHSSRAESFTFITRIGVQYRKLGNSIDHVYGGAATTDCVLGLTWATGLLGRFDGSIGTSIHSFLHLRRKISEAKQKQSCLAASSKGFHVHIFGTDFVSNLDTSMTWEGRSIWKASMYKHISDLT